jgi:hypothetical protein
MTMRLNRILLFSAFFILALGLLSSCKKDNEVKLMVLSPTIDDNDYTGGGTVKFQYSTDEGKTYQASVPQMNEGDVLLVKLNNETNDLTTEEFSFDWSYSSLKPEDPTAAIARFVVKKSNFQVYVIVKDLVLLVTSHRNTGVFYTLDTLTGAKTELFTPLYNSAPIAGTRGFVYHIEKDKFYTSTSTNEGGTIYEIDPATNAATIINENNSGTDPEWFTIANFVVLPDDSLMGIGSLNSSDQYALMKFGTDGKKSPRAFNMDLCCGLAMIYKTDTEELIISDDPDNGSMRLVRSEVDGEVIDTRDIYELENFPTDVSNIWLPTRSMAQDRGGKTFAIMFNYDTKESYLVRINTAVPSVTYITTLGADANNQYNTLAFIPRHAL